jgi:hypothetical protein
MGILHVFAPPTLQVATCILYRYMVPYLVKHKHLKGPKHELFVAGYGRKISSDCEIISVVDADPDLHGDFGRLNPDSHWVKMTQKNGKQLSSRFEVLHVLF